PCVDVVEVEEAFALFRHDSAKPKFAVGQRQITRVLTISKPTHFFLVRPCVLIPQNVKCIEDRLGASKQQVAELWLALRVKTNDFAIEYATAAFQVAAQSFTETGERLEQIPVAR